ncbi:LysR substrate-binding domain-containing protein [Kumtagia ephedrae]|uniref:LysR family transcriptional regulator n=1 Tax=Kumtagia ephedrae TaxID=2116701 RepID=A0A2P7S1E4_9HYPH|nr:LysR substrate-binding domain-containing protein [Mesorhizobium ephedrae]PSJ56304.1 LysR family transcriptional regulator [Mesorhizobium ephedrae]
MSFQLPPLAAIRAFEATARLGSFTKAAAELGMTQAAVSYQIKLLEERVGAPLFLRQPRQIVLTEVGQRLAPAMSEAFSLISDAYASARGEAQGTLTVSTVPTFAGQWLAGRLGSFQFAHPALAVKVESTGRLVDFDREDVDVAIRAGNGTWPGLTTHFLLPTVFTPMLSPALAETIGGVKEPADLMRLPIVDPGDPWWPLWLRMAGLPTDWLKDRPRSQLGSQIFEAQAAMAGRGVALLTPGFYREEIAAGRLLQPLDLIGDDGQAYYLAYAEARRNAPKIKAFRDWILGELKVAGGG